VVCNISPFKMTRLHNITSSLRGSCGDSVDSWVVEIMDYHVSAGTTASTRPNGAQEAFGPAGPAVDVLVLCQIFRGGGVLGPGAVKATVLFSTDVRANLNYAIEPDYGVQ